MIDFLMMAYKGFSYGVGAVTAYYLISGLIALMGRPRPVQ